MKILSKIIFIISGLIIFWAMFIFDTSVPTSLGRVNNLGLMAERQNLLIFGGITLIAGLIIFFVSNEKHQVNGNDKNSKEKENKFWTQKRDIKNDEYKIYLIKKYNIEKNEVLGKYVANKKSYESLDEVVEEISLIDEQDYLQITSRQDFIKNTGKISGFTYTEYGDGNVKVRLSRGKIMKFESISDAKKYFND